MQFCLTTAAKPRAADVLIKANGFGRVGVHGGKIKQPLIICLNLDLEKDCRIGKGFFYILR